jgi:hypothetical protein
LQNITIELNFSIRYPAGAPKPLVAEPLYLDNCRGGKPTDFTHVDQFALFCEAADTSMKTISAADFVKRFTTAPGCHA